MIVSEPLTKSRAMVPLGFAILLTPAAYQRRSLNDP